MSLVDLCYGTVNQTCQHTLNNRLYNSKKNSDTQTAPQQIYEERTVICAIQGIL